MTKDEFLNRVAEGTGLRLDDLKAKSQKAELVAVKRLISFYLHEQAYTDAEICPIIGTSRSRTSELRAEVATASEKSRALMGRLFWQIFAPDDFS
jgi:hypothetical protein